jgi:hypothetical protein
VDLLDDADDDDDDNNNVPKNEAEKILKYEDLKIDIQHMLNANTKVITLITGATGTTSKSFRNYPNNIPGKQGINELQNTAVLGTAHILRDVLT